MSNKGVACNMRGAPQNREEVSAPQPERADVSARKSSLPPSRQQRVEPTRNNDPSIPSSGTVGTQNIAHGAALGCAPHRPCPMEPGRFGSRAQSLALPRRYRPLQAPPAGGAASVVTQSRMPSSRQTVAHPSRGCESGPRAWGRQDGARVPRWSCPCTPPESARVQALRSEPASAGIAWAAPDGGHHPSRKRRRGSESLKSRAR